MSKIADPGDMLEAGLADGSEIMGAELRAELAAGGVPMVIRNAKTSIVTKYGESVGFELEMAGQGKRRGEQWMLLLNKNDVRVRQAEAMIRALAMPDTDGIGPVYLAQVTTKSGQAAWVLQKEPHVGTVTSKAGQRSEVDSSNGHVPEDDDIPF